MRNLSPGIEHLTTRLLSDEPARTESASAEMDRAVYALEKLRAPLKKLAGTAGYSMLLARAVALASKRDASLSPIRVDNDGALAGLAEVRQGSNGNTSALHGGAIILAELLCLLVSFIGESLMLTLVREAWPNADFDPSLPLTEEKP